MEILAAIQTVLLLGCFCMCIYLIQKQNKKNHTEEPISAVLGQRFKRVSKISSEKSILSLPKSIEFGWRPRKVVRMCITGGPCAGKTTSLARLSFRLPEVGYKVFTVPEAATLLRSGGAMINMENFDINQRIQFQLRLVKLQLSLEDIYTTLAERCGKKAIVVCDRGVMDGSAYIDQDLWQAILDEMGLTQVHLRDCRYDAVVHLVTAAQGAEEHFSDASNVSRYEDVEAAREIDRKLQRAWTGHPRMCIIDNERVKSFDDKINKVIDYVFRLLNLPSAYQHSYKFLVKSEKDKDKFLPVIPKHIRHVRVHVEEAFLNSEPPLIERVQKRGAINSNTYLYIKEQMLEDGKRKTESNIISSREYVRYLTKKDESRNTVTRELQCFVWGDDYMILDTFCNVRKGVTLLRIDTNKTTKELDFPKFIEIVRDVKDDPGYSTHNLAKKNWYISEEDKGVLEE